MNKKAANIETMTKALAILAVEKREMSLKELTRAYNATNEKELTREELFYKAICGLLAQNYIKEVKGKELTYKATIKTKLMTR